MTVFSRALERILKLPPAHTRDISVTRNLGVPMRDGVILLADHYAPRELPPAGTLPTVLVRTPYGRRGVHVALYGRPFAERGYRVLIQSCRGTADSGGVFDPFRQEGADGLETMRWIERQPWAGDLVTTGPSYLGFAQWALASALISAPARDPDRDPGARPKAMAVQLAPSDFRVPVYEGGSFALYTLLRWTRQREAFRNVRGGGMLRALREALYQGLGFEERRLRRAFARLPLFDLDRLATGHRVDYFRDWLEHDAPGDAWWASARHSGAVPQVDAPVHLLGGWHDVFLPGTLRDYGALRDAGSRPYLTVGPWAHENPRWTGVATRESLAFFDAHVKGVARGDAGGECGGLREAPVRVYVGGAEEWRDYPDFPPPGSRPERWHLQGGGRLAPGLPKASEPDRYRYDPADPTPSVGGAFVGPGAGPKDNRRLEARPDVLLYTSAPLSRDLEAVGLVEAELFVRSSLKHADFFARLCDVDPKGKSVNVSDALLRVAPGRPETQADGTLRLRIELWPTAHRFRRGYRLRLQVSSGAHPRLARNTGSGEPLATATRLVVAEQEVLHDLEHPSALILNVLGRLR